MRTNISNKQQPNKAGQASLAFRQIEESGSRRRTEKEWRIFKNEC